MIQVENAPGAGKKILIIEDNTDSREVLSIQLKARGYDIVEAADAIEGERLALVEAPDLIVLDLGLPHVDGIKAATLFKQNPKTNGIPLIAYTAWDREYFEAKAKKAGFAIFLTKPIAPKIFTEIIEKLLRKKSGEFSQPGF